MLDLLDQLRSALGGTYRISHELTGGHEPRLRARRGGPGASRCNQVLPPALAAAVSVDRFRREIQLAGSLQHPHIVPLHSAAGFVT